MGQMSLAQQAEFQRFAKKSRREQFLEEMEAVMPWADLLTLIEPHYPKGEQGASGWGLGSCCGFISCSMGLRSPTRRLKTRCTIRPRCAASWASI